MLCYQNKHPPTQLGCLYVKSILRFASTRTLHRGQLLFIVIVEQPILCLHIGQSPLDESC